jgi:signal transduction histidine kinase
LASAHEARAGLAELAGLCHEAYRDVREAILGLRESSSGRTLLESLAAYVDKFSRVSGIVTTLETDQPDLALGPRCEVQVIRVIQEALTNVRKHSGATTAVVRVSAGPQSTSFVVEDDGDGFDPAAHRADAGGFGLHTMRERTELVNGSLTVDSAPGQGTRVVVRLPSAPRAHVPEAVGA